MVMKWLLQHSCRAPLPQISTPKEVSKERETVSEEFQAEPRPAACPVLDLGVESAFSKLYKL